MNVIRETTSKLAGVLLALVHGRGFVLAMSTLALLAVLAAGVRAWQGLRPLVLQDPRYQVTLESIQITPPPEWIRRDARLIKSDVADAAGWNFPIWLGEPQLTWDVARAFRRHPWVREVRRAEKSFPAAIRVDLVYRQPVAKVEVYEDGKRGLIPIDGEGYCLATDDFTKWDLLAYLEIRVPGIEAKHYTGPWGEPRVHGAARIAEVLAPYRESLGIKAILAPETPATVAVDTMSQFAVEFQNGRIEPWGHPPGEESLMEPKAADKINLWLQAAGLAHGADQAQAIRSLERISQALQAVRTAAGTVRQPASFTR